MNFQKTPIDAVYLPHIAALFRFGHYQSFVIIKDLQATFTPSQCKERSRWCSCLKSCWGAITCLLYNSTFFHFLLSLACSLLVDHLTALKETETKEVNGEKKTQNVIVRQWEVLSQQSTSI